MLTACLEAFASSAIVRKNNHGQRSAEKHPGKEEAQKGSGKTAGRFRFIFTGKEKVACPQK
jgi:hypothetical protein